LKLFVTSSDRASELHGSLVSDCADSLGCFRMLLDVG